MLATATHAVDPNPWMVAPFVLLLVCIAVMPLAAHHFWEHHYGKIAVTLGVITGSYYLFVLKSPDTIGHVAQEYVNFMAFIGSLYVISGGINIRVKGEATPMVNTVFLLIGAVIANVIGTTGASMLLIRPWIKMNKVRVTMFHIVFFIFIVSNCGGCLTPIGDPPLFLGYLRGIPFWWVIENAWFAWLLVICLLLAVFYIMDTINFKRAPKHVQQMERQDEEWTFRGLSNVFLLGVVLVAVFIPPSYRIGNDSWNVPFSALLMLLAAVVSYKTTRREIHNANDFNFHPVQEVGFLFIGIFLTMMPALDILKGGDALAMLKTPIQYYFACGTLSAMLDNAPTYLAFLAAEMGAYDLDIANKADVVKFLTEHNAMVLAVSLGAVFFGAGTYIGNGPNFMVKAIAEKSKVHMPSFFGYILWFTLPILVPILAIVGWIVLRNGH